MGQLLPRYANGAVVSPTSLTSVSGYLQQVDLPPAYLSVRSTLESRAPVGVHAHLPSQETRPREHAELPELGLST